MPKKRLTKAKKREIDAIKAAIDTLDDWPETVSLEFFYKDPSSQPVDFSRFKIPGSPKDG